MIGWFKRYLRRRAIERRLISFAKTKEGRRFIEAMNNNNLFLADWDAQQIGAGNPYIGGQIRIRLPKNYSITDSVAWID